MVTAKFNLDKRSLKKGGTYPGKFTWQSWVALAILLIGILVYLFSGK